MISLFFNRKFIVYFAVIASLIALVYFWRADIISGVESAYKASINQKTLEVSEESRKATSEVKKHEQTISDIDRALCSLGIVRHNRGCED